MEIIQSDELVEKISNSSRELGNKLEDYLIDNGYSSYDEGIGLIRVSGDEFQKYVKEFGTDHYKIEPIESAYLLAQEAV